MQRDSISFSSGWRGQLAPTQPRQAPAGAWEAGLRERALELLERYEERFELLYRAARQARLPMPGVLEWSLQHAPSPKGELVEAHLTRLLTTDAATARAVQVALYRYQQLARAVGWRRDTVPWPPADREAFKRLLLYLGNVSVELGGQPLLARLFPPPRKLDASPPPPPPPPAADDPRRRRAVALRDGLAPRLAIVRRALGPRTGAAPGRSGPLDVAGLEARMLALELGNDAPLRARLEEALQRFDELVSALAEGADGERLAAIATPLSQLGLELQQHPRLRRLMTRAVR